MTRQLKVKRNFAGILAALMVTASPAAFGQGAVADVYSPMAWASTLAAQAAVVGETMAQGAANMATTVSESVANQATTVSSGLATQMAIFSASANQAAEQKAATEVQTQVAGEVSNRAVDTSKMAQTTRAIEEHQLAPNHCATGASADGARVAREQNGAAAAGIAKQSALTPLVRAPSQMTSAAITRDAHDNQYCSDAEYRAGFCASKGAVSSGNRNFEAADVQASSLFTGADVTNHGFGHNYSPKEAGAARVYTNNAIDPISPPNLSPAQYKTQQGMAYRALEVAYQAKLGIAREVAAQLQSQNTPIGYAYQLDSSGGVVTDKLVRVDGAAADSMYKYALDIVKDVPELEPSFRKATEGDGRVHSVSKAMLLEMEVARRNTSAKWHADISRATPAAVARDQTFMQATMLDIALQQLRALNRIEWMLAQQSADQTRQTMMQQLNAQREAALNSATR